MSKYIEAVKTQNSKKEKKHVYAWDGQIEKERKAWKILSILMYFCKKLCQILLIKILNDTLDSISKKFNVKFDFINPNLQLRLC